MKKAFIKTIIILFMLSFVCYVKATEEREPISSIVATSNTESLVTYGAKMVVPTFEVTSGTEAHFATNNGGWYRYEDGQWAPKRSGYNFYSGDWHYETQVRIDGEMGNDYILDNSAVVMVDGVDWHFSYGSYGTDFSYGWVYSPTYHIDEPVELNFFAESGYNIPVHQVTLPITSYNVANSVEGGTKPYSFEKVDGPEWISVSETGVVSGTPTEVGTNKDLIIRVTDAADDTKEITISVGRTKILASDREVISNIVATSNTSSIPVLNSKIQEPTFEVTSGTEAHFATSNGGWYKKVGDDWERKNGDFTAGIWHYETQVRIDNEAGELYVLGNESVVTVDGEPWGFSYGSYGDTFSYGWVASPEYVITGVINSIQLDGTFSIPKIGQDIVDPIITVKSLNKDTSLASLATVVEAVWQEKTGDGFFDWKAATGKFEENKTYHIRLLVTINSDEYELANIPTFPVTLDSYIMDQFQLNNKSVGEFIEFATLEPLSKPTVYLYSDNNKISLYWDSSKDATKYEVSYSTDKKKWTKKEVTDYHTDITGLKYNKKYYFRVRTFDGTKWTEYSDIVSKKIVPNKVENLKVTSGSTNNLKVSWDKVNVTGYEVYMGTKTSNMKKVKTITKNSTLTYNKTKLKANTKYYFKVRAYKTVSGKKVYGSFSDVINTKTAPAKPKASFKLIDYNAFDYTFGTSKGATKYIVGADYSKSFNTDDYEEITFLDGNTIHGTTAAIGHTLYARVKACNADDICSGWTTTSIKIVPLAPKLTLTTTSKKVKITLTSVNGASGYQIYRATSKKGKYKLIKEFTTEDELFEYVNSTKKGTTYYYKVRSYRVVDENKVYSSYSSIKSIRSK